MRKGAVRMQALAMNSATGKRLLALVRDGDYAHPGEEEANRLLLSGLGRDLSRRVLDAGCGSGGTAAWMQENGYGTVTGIELDAETVGLAQERYPELRLVQGDLCRAADLGVGPFDLIYTMTALYAVPEQADVLAQLRALAAPGAELRLFEYSDPRGRFDAARSDNASREWWRPLDPLTVPTLLAEAGWEHAGTEDLSAAFERWYVDLCARIVARREAIVREFGERWFAFVAVEYEGILGMVRAGQLGGVLLRATAA